MLRCDTTTRRDGTREAVCEHGYLCMHTVRSSGLVDKRPTDSVLQQWQID